MPSSAPLMARCGEIRVGRSPSCDDTPLSDPSVMAGDRSPAVTEAEQARVNRVVPARVRWRPGAPDPHGLPAALDGHVPERFAVLVLDIDDFCEVNDALGHVAGDTVLEHVGSRLGRLGGPPVRFTRLSGDEFAALVPRPPERPGADQPLEIAARALRAIRRPLVIDDIEIAPSASRLRLWRSMPLR